ncbi:MAG TPA: tryptophan-rich sensory protein [Chitinophagaceae bacterium]|nr:tryptophan-rich sensory protein [Chitinophagaceae bacterium]
MEWPALLKTIALCLISIFVEALSATKEGRLWFEQLKRPKYSFSLRIWYFVGAVNYVIFGIIAYRQFSASSGIFSTGIILLVLVMLINGLSNFIIFKYHSLKWFYLIVYPFGFLLLALITILFPNDKLSAALAFIYFLWLIYDLYYGYNLWKLNS